MARNTEEISWFVRSKHKRARSLFRQKKAKRRILRQAQSDWFDGHCAIGTAADWIRDPETGEYDYVFKPYLKRNPSNLRKLLKTQTNRRFRRGRRFWYLKGKSALYKRAFDDWGVY